MSDWHLYTHEDEYAHLALLDAVNAAVCLLQPYTAERGGQPGFAAVEDDGNSLTTEGQRGLVRVVRALDGALEALETVGNGRGYHLRAGEVLVPLRWGLHSLERAHFHNSRDFPPPEDSVGVLYFAFDQLRRLGDVLRDEAAEIAKALDTPEGEEAADV